MTIIKSENARAITKCSSNKGFSSNSNILPRIKFSVGGQVSSPQSLTAYSLERYAQAEKRQRQSKLTMKMEY